MARRKFDRKPPCAEWLPGDGVDPRYDRDEEPRVVNRKALQLCAQVADTIRLCLPDLRSDLLRQLDVESVRPWPDSRQLMVTLVGEATDAARAEAEARTASKSLRAEVAAAITRKRVPRLLFRVRSAAPPDQCSPGPSSRPSARFGAREAGRGGRRPLP